jgi:hypothetical protein
MENSVLHSVLPRDATLTLQYLAELGRDVAKLVPVLQLVVAVPVSASTHCQALVRLVWTEWRLFRADFLPVHDAFPPPVPLQITVVLSQNKRIIIMNMMDLRMGRQRFLSMEPVRTQVQKNVDPMPL